MLLSGSGRPVLQVLAGLTVVLALAGGLILGRGMSAQGTELVTDPVSLGFARDMSTHHAQAVEMSEIAHRRSTDPDLTYMAFDILSTQQGQIGIMSGYLDLWEQPFSGEDEPMAWMGHGGAMPGMASKAEIEQLRTLPVAAMEEQYLRLMIRHHRGAVPMADAASDGAKSAELSRLAADISAGQQSEIDAMQDMLRQRGLAPEPQGHGDEDGHDGTAPSASAPPSHASH